VPDRAQEFLTEGYVAHVGFEQDGRPYVIPMLSTRPTAPTASISIAACPAARCGSWLPVCRFARR
jgi:nitroimidazol reductase NimA-like FMN-containing flavoprotein (pyridoxamine 5'-phosphate oxidase superfamily)